MGGIIVRGMIERGIVAAKHITVADIDKTRLEELRSSLGIRTTTDNQKPRKARTSFCWR